jgi:glyoxylase-like metal-dependent hydrolase (beta-lactamase superfamily II)
MTGSAPWRGGAVGAHAVCVLAPNAGPMTLDGTNTWVLRAGPDPQSGPAVVVDPGPLDRAHLAAVREVAGEITLVLLTHGHLDHSEGAAELAAQSGCGVRALDPVHRLGAEGLADGDVVSAGGLEVRVVGTPGHTSDSVCFLLPDGSVLTGDTVLGRGTTMVAAPDGRLADYLASLRLLRRLAADSAVASVLPGHGPVVDDVAALLDAYLSHRAARLEQVRAAFAGGATTVDAVVTAVYADIDPAVRPAAERSVAAQLEYLRSGG